MISHIMNDTENASFFSSHPYIFFNRDKISITFVGFRVTTNCDLVQPNSGDILERNVMSQALYSGLRRQGVNFNEDYRTWMKGEMIYKLSIVMGIDSPCDPDETYVLNADNLIKILAIQMRFRYEFTSHFV